MRYNTLPVGHTIAGRFVIEAALGHGRSSAVYRALDHHTRTRVALKMLDPFLAQDPVSVERFAREVTILRTVSHPNIVRVYDFLRDGDAHVICMEYIDGLDGKAFLARFGRLALADFLHVARQIAAALDACHRLKVLHRDLKPQNVLITANRDVKLVDFGISRINTMSDLTKTGTILGTPEYMAPELFVSTKADPRSDIYAIGAVLYELLTARPPHVATSLSTIMAQQLRGDVEPIATFRKDIPHWVDAIVSKCLRTDPNNRYQSGYELLRDLQRGERARAAYLEKQPVALCLNCHADRIAGLPFCHQCGHFSQDVYAKGRSSVILYGSDDLDGLANQLRRIFPAAPSAAVRTGLGKPPVVLFSDISRDTAMSVVNELAVFPCELRVTQNLAKDLRLPQVYLGLMLVALLPVFALDSFFGRLGLTAACEVLLVWLYRRRVRPLIRLSANSEPARQRADQHLIDLARRFTALHDPNLKTILGTIASSFLQLRRRLAKAPSVFDADTIATVVSSSVEAAHTLERYETYLSSRSLNDIRDKLAATDLRLRQSQATAGIAALIEAKAKLRREFTDYQAIQELHAKLYISLLNLNTVLRQIEDSFADGGAAPETLRTEVAQIQADFLATQPEMRLAASA